MSGRTDGPVAAFERNHIPVPEAGCWLWTRPVARRHYPLVSVEGRRIGAHRFSWQIHRGPIPDGMCVCHKCDTPTCVNPDHLFLGTVLDNNADKLDKGRARAPKGAANGNSKLTDAQVLAIRADFRRQIDIAAAYGVRGSLISAIKLRRKWNHLPPREGDAPAPGRGGHNRKELRR